MKIAWLLAAALLFPAAQPRAGTITVLHVFQNAADGGLPLGLVQDKAGNFYGRTDYCAPPAQAEHCGVVFKLDPAGAFTPLATIDGFSEDFIGVPRLYLLGNRLYGSYVDGANPMGTIFSLRTDGTGLRDLHVFKGNDGNAPGGAMAMDTAGNLFGTTIAGGRAEPHHPVSGVLFEIPQGGGLRVLHRFTQQEGFAPNGVALDDFGNIFGGTVKSVYEYGTATGTFTSLHRFAATEGRNPRIAGVLHGTLYGFAQYTSRRHAGTLFELAPVDGAYTFQITHVFKATDGFTPNGLSVIAPHSVLGVASGYPYSFKPNAPPLTGLGTLFSATGSTFTILQTFAEAALHPNHPAPLGSFPAAPPILTSSGAIVGTTVVGGQLCPDFSGEGCSTIYRYAP